MVLDAFVVERLHLAVNAVVEPIRNISRYEYSVLSGVLNVQFRRAAGEDAKWIGDNPLMALEGKVLQVRNLTTASRLCCLALKVRRATPECSCYQRAPK